MCSTDWLLQDCLTALEMMSPVLNGNHSPWLLIGAVARDYTRSGISLRDRTYGRQWI